MPRPHEEVELGDLENEAFLPNQDWLRKSGKQDSIFIRWLPDPIKGLANSLSRVKVSKADIPNRDRTWNFGIVC